MRTDYNYPTDGLPLVRPPKQGGVLEPIDNRFHALLVAEHERGPEDSERQGRVIEVNPTYGGDTYWRADQASAYYRYFRGPGLNTPTRSGHPVMLLGVDGASHEHLPWVVGRVTARTQGRITVEVLWTPPGAERIVGRTVTGDAWVRVVAIPPKEYLPRIGDDEDTLAVKAYARNIWLRWQVAWAGMQIESGTRGWGDAMQEIAEAVDFTVPASPWRRTATVVGFVPTDRHDVTQDMVERTNPTARRVSTTAYAQVTMPIEFHFLAVDPNGHTVDPSEVQARANSMGLIGVQGTPNWHLPEQDLY